MSAQLQQNGRHWGTSVQVEFAVMSRLLRVASAGVDNTSSKKNTTHTKCCSFSARWPLLTSIMVYFNATTGYAQQLPREL